MKLDPKTIAWIESAAGDLAYGEIILVIHDKQIVKIITEDRRVHIRKTLDRANTVDLDSG